MRDRQREGVRKKAKLSVNPSNEKSTSGLKGTVLLSVSLGSYVFGTSDIIIMKIVSLRISGNSIRANFDFDCDN